MQSNESFKKEIIENSPLKQVPLEQITIRKGWNIRKDIEPIKVDEISKSMSIIGLLKPILINGKLEIIAGERRYHAAKKLGWSDVTARVVDFKNPNHEKLAHLDENLEHKTLAAGDHAQAISERKAIWESIFPETRQGSAGGHAKARKPNEDSTSDNLSPANSTSTEFAHDKKPKSFAKQEAENARVDERTIQRKAKIGAKCSPTIKAALNDTKITGDIANKLSSESHKVQDRVLELLQSESYKGTKHTSDLIKALIEVAKGNDEIDLIVDKKWGSISRERWLKKFSDISQDFQIQFPTLVNANLLEVVEDATLTKKIKSQIAEIYFLIIKAATTFELQDVINKKSNRHD